MQTQSLLEVLADLEITCHFGEIYKTRVRTFCWNDIGKKLLLLANNENKEYFFNKTTRSSSSASDALLPSLLAQSQNIPLKLTLVDAKLGNSNNMSKLLTYFHTQILLEVLADLKIELKQFSHWTKIRERKEFLKE